MAKSVTVRAPCSTANLGPGFDVFGMALDAFYDEVTVTKKPKSFGIKIVSSDDIPLDPKKNTAGIVAIEMRKVERIKDGLEIKIKKNVPAGYGMGSSAASAAACTRAIDELFSLKLDGKELLEYAGAGEKASAGTIHYDNVAASLFGEFVVVNSLPDFWVLPCPRDLKLVIAVPKIKVPKQKTKASRGVLPKNVKFSDAMENMANALAMVANLANKMGSHEFAKWIDDDPIVTPARKKMIPGFDKVVDGAMSVRPEPIAVTISGAGPSVIAFCTENEKKIGEGMKKGFKSAKVDCEIVICKPSKGPKITKRK